MASDVRNSTYWIKLSETMDSADWPPKLEGKGWQLTMSRDITVSGCDSTPFRTSPVFPVSESFEVPDFNSSTLYLSFLCFDRAFRVVARLLERSPDSLKNRLMVTLGLASVAVWSQDDAIEMLEPFSDDSPRCWEVWTISNGYLTNIRCHKPPRVKTDSSWNTLACYDVLPPPARATVDEFIAATELIVGQLATFIPNELEPFQRLIGRALELVAEMVFACNPSDSPPESLSEYTADNFRNDKQLAEVVLHQAWDRLIQINSALAYFSTQALSGATPLLERRSLIRRHSLLGVGTGVLALTRLTRTVERAFAVGAIESIIDEFAHTGAPLPGLDQLPNYDATQWSQYSLNQWNGKVDQPYRSSKVPYFSGRLGFRETEYTISASLQSLTAGAHPEWSFLTLTHEMVHGHVRSILALIFQGDKTEDPDSKWKRFYARYAAICRRQPIDSPKLLDSLRTAVLAYCCFAQSHGSLTRDTDLLNKPMNGTKIGFEFYLPEERALWTLLEREFRNISEILVHVLDFHYFYFSRIQTYIQMVWRSWAPLPQVKGDLRQYILRSLLVIATKTTGTPHQRFNKSRALFREILEHLASSEGRGSTTIAAALEILPQLDKLHYPFAGSLILVDLANRVLTSTDIRGAVFADDPHVGITESPGGIEDSLDYTMPQGFVDGAVHSPAVFLADRIGNGGLELDSRHIELETLRMFLACAATPE